MTAGPRPGSDADAAAGIRFVTRGLGADEVAAVTAVLTTALRQQAQADAAPAAPSAWARSLLRTTGPLPHSWRSFSG